MRLPQDMLVGQKQGETFGPVCRDVSFLEGGAHVLEPSICYFILKLWCF